MDKVLEVLSKYLEDDTSLPKITTGLGLVLDHISWIIGAVVSVGLGLLADLAGSGCLPGIANGTDGQGTYLRIIRVAGVLVGAAVACLVKRYYPLKDNAFFEGMVVGWPMCGSASLSIAHFLDGLCGLGSI